MRALTVFSGIAAPLGGDNIDTDRIIPARLMRNPRDENNDYSRWLFHDLRFDDDGREISDFVLNQHIFRDATILVSGDNFGCGSSRESAVYALMDYGIRIVVASSFGDIFYANCVRNGVAPLTIDSEALLSLRRWLTQCETPRLRVDLESYTIQPAEIQQIQKNLHWTFAIADFHRDRLMRGEDEVDVTLKRLDQIDAFERSYLETHPWLHPDRN